MGKKNKLLKLSSWSRIQDIIFCRPSLGGSEKTLKKTEITKQDAIYILIKSAQAETYCDILAALSKKSELPDKHPVSKLSPFIQ